MWPQLTANNVHVSTLVYRVEDHGGCLLPHEGQGNSVMVVMTAEERCLFLDMSLRRGIQAVQELCISLS